MNTGRVMRSLGTLLWTVSLGVGASNGPAAIIRTQQTQLRLLAGEDAPMVADLESGRASWLNKAPEKLIDAVSVEGKSVPVRWKLDSRASHSASDRVTFVYECAAPPMQLTWEWRAPSVRGPIEHRIRIRNLSANDTIWLPLQDSFQYRFAVDANTRLQNFYIEKGAGKPSEVGTHRDNLLAGARWYGYSSTYAHSSDQKGREIIPFFAIENVRSQSGWYVGVEFSGRIRVAVARDAVSVSGSIGLNPDPGPFRTRLQAGETFETPTVFLGAYAGGTERMGNVLRWWVRETLANPHTWANAKYPLLVNNSWGGGMSVNETTAQRMIRDSAELGLEMFHVDAGWFRGVGDWYPDPQKFPHGLATVADYAHQHGLQFGLWVDWTQAALDTQSGALNLNDPKVQDWTVSDLPSNWRPQPFKGQTIDLGAPAAHAYAQSEVLRIADDYRLDMLEHDGYLVTQGCVREDHPHAPPDPKRLSIKEQDGAYIVESSNSTDVSERAVRAYYAIHEEIRRRHSNLLLEVCNDGGRMVDFGSAAHGDYFSITDTYDPVSNRRAFYDASHLLPAPMLESYVAKWPTPRLENFRYMLRSGMMGWLTIMQDTNGWTPEEHAAAKQEFAVYKNELRPLIRNADLYHVGARPDGVHWDGIEYFDHQRNRGVLFAFRGSNREESRHRFVLAGLPPRNTYRLRFHDGSSSDQFKTSRELLAAGLTLELPIPNSSELVFIEQSRQP